MGLWPRRHVPGTEALQLAPGHNVGWTYSFLTLSPNSISNSPEAPGAAPFLMFSRRVGVGARSSPSSRAWQVV